MKLKINDLKDVELKSKLEELRRELMKQNAQVSTGTSSKGHKGNIKNIKKNIARIKTKMTEVSKKA